jgi:hypothetical protein
MTSLSHDRRRFDLDGLILVAARAGYAARGFVYLSVGALALLAAMDLRASPAGNLGALEPIARAPFGEWWLILIGVGLGAFAAWRALQAIFDADREGRSTKALVKRAGQGISSLVYGALAVSVLQLADELEDVGEADEEQRADQHAAFMLHLPMGEWLLMGAGLVVIAVGVGNIAHAIDRRFSSDLDCSQFLKKVAKPIGRAGYFARGLAFGALGVTMVRAGFHARSSEAAGLGGALQALETKPGGEILLLIVAAGLFLFGVFGLVEARYRELRTPQAIQNIAP